MHLERTRYILAREEVITHRSSRILRETMSPITILMRGFKEPLENALIAKGG